jgi:hypothetical protein
MAAPTDDVTDEMMNNIPDGQTAKPRKNDDYDLTLLEHDPEFNMANATRIDREANPVHVTERMQIMNQVIQCEFGTFEKMKQKGQPSGTRRTRAYYWVNKETGHKYDGRGNKLTKPPSEGTIIATPLLEMGYNNFHPGSAIEKLTGFPYVNDLTKTKQVVTIDRESMVTAVDNERCKIKAQYKDLTPEQREAKLVSYKDGLAFLDMMLPIEESYPAELANEYVNHPESFTKPLVRAAIDKIIEKNIDMSRLVISEIPEDSPEFGVLPQFATDLFGTDAAHEMFIAMALGRDAYELARKVQLGKLTKGSEKKKKSEAITEKNLGRVKAITDLVWTMALSDRLSKLRKEATIDELTAHFTGIYNDKEDHLVLRGTVLRPQRKMFKRRPPDGPKTLYLTSDIKDEIDAFDFIATDGKYGENGTWVYKTALDATKLLSHYVDPQLLKVYGPDGKKIPSEFHKLIRKGAVITMELLLLPWGDQKQDDAPSTSMFKQNINVMSIQMLNNGPEYEGERERPNYLDQTSRKRPSDMDLDREERKRLEMENMENMDD